MLSVAASATAYVQAPAGRAVAGRTSSPAMTESWQTKAQSVGLAAALAFGAATQAQAGPFTRSEIASLTYEQVKGTGLANTCPTVEGGGKTALKLNGKNYINEFCLEPTSFQVLEDKLTKAGVVTEAVNTKVTTRQTYVLTGIEGDLLSEGGKLKFVEKDGIDYAPTTVQLPGGERVPFLFTIKELVAKGQGSAFKPGYEFGGSFKVPSYRTGLFLDPKGRGMTTGYDQAQALAASQTGLDGQAELENEINKVFDVFDGTIEFAVSNVNAAEGEIGGVFVSSQASDTDLGSKTPKKVLSKGIFYGRIEKQ